VVDNASPEGNVEHSLQSAAPSRVHVHIVRAEGPSRAQLGSWAAAWQWLQAPARPSFQRFVLLQHSTLLLRPLPPPRPGCAATALDGILGYVNLMIRKYALQAPMHKWFDPHKYLNRDMEYASAVAESIGIPCLPPCVTTNTRCTNWDYSAEARSTPWRRALELGAAESRKCLSWGTVPHSVLALSLQGWETLVSLRLWPQGVARPVVREMRFLWSLSAANGTVPLSANGSSNPVERAMAGRSTWGVNIVGLERLSGVLLAAINDRAAFGNGSDVRGHPGQDRMRVSSETEHCGLPPGSVIHKIHGRTHRNTTRPESCLHA
jgi:hypothetical protein